MSARFEELDWSPTPLGEVSLCRRRDPVTGVDVFEVKLGDEFLVSSQFTAAEIEVARLALAVGGLGLGYTMVGAGRHEGSTLTSHRPARTIGADQFVTLE